MILRIPLVLLIFSGTVQAEESRVERAKVHFAAGQKAYQEARYDQALVEFQAGYADSPRPEFLINFAQTYRRLGRYDDAVTECERYLATGTKLALEGQAKELLATLKTEREARAKEGPSPSPVVDPYKDLAPAPTGWVANPIQPVQVVPLPAELAVRRGMSKGAKVGIALAVVGGVLLIGAAVTAVVLLLDMTKEYLLPMGSAR